jgi:hypothetical protein
MNASIKLARIPDSSKAPRIFAACWKAARSASHIAIAAECRMPTLCAVSLRYTGRCEILSRTAAA